jgi:hypothetical protein
MNSIEAKGLIKTAFKKLRAMGFVARMNFKCCMTCACAALDEMTQGKSVRGCVYYHSQDASVLNRRSGWYDPEEEEHLAIRYTEGEGEDKLSGEQVGATVFGLFNGLGLDAEWDYNADNVIYVKFTQ